MHDRFAVSQDLTREEAPTPPVGRASLRWRTLAMLRLLVSGERRQAARVYTLWDRHFFLGLRTRYLNLGYWDGATTHDEAGDALAEQVGLAAGMAEGDTVLDVGFGFGDQDEYWLRRFRPARIIGLNVTALHVEEARRRFPDPRLDFRLGSATDMDLPEASVDRVAALECAFHFATRQDFFREAFRVLRPGGRLATADLLSRPGRHSLASRLLARAGQALFQIPPENWYGAGAYRRRLEAAGFESVDLRPVRNRVIVPFWEATQRLARRPVPGRRLHPLLRLAARAPLRWFDALDYVLCSAVKAGRPVAGP
jgi:SAM-dependent methyltransferase